MARPVPGDSITHHQFGELVRSLLRPEWWTVHWEYNDQTQHAREYQNLIETATLYASDLCGKRVEPLGVIPVGTIPWSQNYHSSAITWNEHNRNMLHEPIVPGWRALLAAIDRKGVLKPDDWLKWILKQKDEFFNVD